MSLFGAATSGVDPQTGSYLNKEQRIAMFRASQGRGGSGGGTGSGKKAGPTVDPQSQIVVVRKNFSNIVRTVQEQTQEATSTVASQVAENRKSIENLYNLIAAEKKQELKLEKAETRNAKLERENVLRRAREKLIEGMSSALAGLANFGKGLADKALSPAKGLLDRILQALGLLGTAWAIDNLPTILDGIRDFLDGLPKTKEEFMNSLFSIRGVWSVLDRMLGGVKKAIGRIARAAFNVGRYIFRKATEIGGRVFRSVKNFLVDLVGGIVKQLKSVVSGLWRNLTNALQPPKVQGPELPKGMDPSVDPAPPTPKPQGEIPKGTDPDLSGGGYQDGKGNLLPGPKEPPKKKNILQKTQDWFSDRFKGFNQKITGGETTKGVDKAVQFGPQTAEEAAKTKAGVDKVGAKNVSAVEKFFKPLTKLLPDGGKAFNGIMRRIFGVLGKIPGIGLAIDTGLNLLAGQDFLQALIRGFGSNLAGAGGWVGGAAIGGKIGAIAGAPFAGVGAIPGAAIGSILGGIIGSIAAGAVGDQLGAAAYEYATGKPRTENKVMGTEAVNNLTKMATGETLPGYVTSDQELEAMPQTPELPTAQPITPMTSREAPTAQPESMDPAADAHDSNHTDPEGRMKLPDSDLSGVPTGNADNISSPNGPATAITPDSPDAPNYEPAVQSALEALGFVAPKAESLTSKATSGASTPDGMTATDAARAKTTVINMPPKVTNIEKDQGKEKEMPNSTEGKPIPRYSTRDPESDKYRATSAKYYKLLF